MKIGLTRKLYNAEVRSRRLALGLSQAALAEKIGVQLVLISRVETLKTVSPDCPTVQKLAAFFGVPAETLCPRWLAAIEEVPKESRVEREVRSEDLAYLRDPARARLPFREERDDAGYDLAWVERTARRILSDDEQATLFLFMGLGQNRMTIPELAGHLMVSESTVKTRIYRSREKLARAWAAERDAS